MSQQFPKLICTTSQDLGRTILVSVVSDYD